VMLGVDRNDCPAVLPGRPGDELPSRNEWLLVRDGRDLARPQGSEASGESDETWRPEHEDTGLRLLDDPLECRRADEQAGVRLNAGGRSVLGDRSVWRLPPCKLRGEGWRPVAGRESDDP